MWGQNYSFGGVVLGFSKMTPLKSQNDSFEITVIHCIYVFFRRFLLRLKVLRLNTFGKVIIHELNQKLYKIYA